MSVCVSLYPCHLPAVLLSESTIWRLSLLKERERRNQKKREGDRKSWGGGEKLKNFRGTSSLRLSSSLLHSLCLAFLFDTHFPFLLTLSFKFTLCPSQHLFPLVSLLFFSKLGSMMEVFSITSNIQFPYKGKATGRDFYLIENGRTK